MARPTRLSILAPLALATALPLGACIHDHGGNGGPGAEVVVVPERGGPPPHAPAHGYRRKHHVENRDVELVFDSGLGVYVVVGFPDVYFDANVFFRLADVGWQVSMRPDGGWTLAAADRVPPGLAKAKGGNGKSAKGPKKGGPPGPAKGRPF
jgi:hypothetical protein